MCGGGLKGLVALYKRDTLIFTVKYARPSFELKKAFRSRSIAEELRNGCD